MPEQDPDVSGAHPWEPREEWADPEIPVTDRKTGTATFEMDPFPAVLGGPLCGTFRTSLPARNMPEDGVQVRLCRYERRLARGSSQMSMESTRGLVDGWEERERTKVDMTTEAQTISVGSVLALQWQTSTRMDVIPADDGATIDIPVCFEAVPADHPPSTITPPDDLGTTDDRVVWTVEVLCNVAGIDYEGAPNAFRGDWFSAVEVPVLSSAPPSQEADAQVSVGEYAQHEKEYEPDRPLSDAVDLQRRGSGRLEVHVDPQPQPVVWYQPAILGVFGAGAGALAYGVAVNAGMWHFGSLGFALLSVFFFLLAVKVVVSPQATRRSQITVGPDGTKVQMGDENGIGFRPLWTAGLVESGGFVPHADLKEVRVEVRRPERALVPSTDGVSASRKAELPDELSDWPDAAIRDLPEKRDLHYPNAANVCELVLVTDGADGEERVLAARCPDTLEAAWIGEQIEAAVAHHRQDA
jgi:hypothetical protein